VSLSDLATVLLLFGILIIISLAVIAPRLRENSNNSNSSSDLAVLTELGTAIATTPANIEELSEVAYVEAVRFFEMDFFQLGLFEADRYRTQFWIKDGKRADNKEFLLSDTTGIISWIRRSNQPLLVEDFNNEVDSLPAQPSYYGEDPPTSGIFAPLLIGEESIGIISAQSRQSSMYSHDHLHFLTILANTLAGPIALSLINTEIDFLKQQVGNNEEISRVLASPISLESRLSQVVSMIHQGSDILGVRFFEYTEGELNPLVQEPADLSQMGVDRGLIRHALATRKCETRHHTPLERTPTGDDQTRRKFLSELAVPVSTEDQVFGVLQILQGGETTFTDLQRSQAEAIAANIALAVLESRVTASQQEENWFTTVLLEVARHASQPGDMDTALQAVLQLTTILTGTSWALLLVRERTESMMRMGPSAGISRQTQLMLSDVRISMEGLGLSTTKSDTSPFAIQLPDPLSSLLDTTDATAVALGTEGEMSGVFIMEGKEIPDRQISLIRGIANQISLRLENYKLIEEVAARRSLERELDTARTIQQSFLPQEIPTFKGWEIGVNWSFARQVGGDFYDFIPLDDGPGGKRWGIVIADVTDKGIPAALFMALCRTLLRSVAINRIDPGSTLTRLNELLFADTQAELLVSLIYAVWEPEVSRLSFANAGHNPPLLFKPFQTARVLTDHGIVLGAILEASYTTQIMEFQPGELMVFYTDGVTEVMDTTGEMFGVHRLENLVLGLRHWSGQGVADHISKRVADFCDTYELPDDLTTVVLYRPDSS
jgi:serine phosphatase RsbU (regulator of sigma subunit)/putative methionine-R-sulfoxide reductase with GAF domain